VLASSMGQQPYVADNYPAGRITVKMRDVNRILQIVGAEGVTKVDPVMASEWNVTIPDHTKRSHAKEALASAYRTSPDDPTFSIMETGQLLLISPRGMARADAVTRVHFPVTREGAPQEFPFDELFRTDDPTPKEAKHDPVGVLAFWGKKIRKGVEIADTTNVDIAPTVLSLLGVPVPRTMQGRILDDAWDAPRSSRLAAVGARISITA